MYLLTFFRHRQLTGEECRRVFLHGGHGLVTTARTPRNLLRVWRTAWQRPGIPRNGPFLNGKLDPSHRPKR